MTLSLAACADDICNDIRGSEGGDISFSMGVAPITRATTGATAADLLGGAFYVYGIKNEGAVVQDGSNVVFQNYKVAYTDGSANTSTTNRSGWEYVGQSLSDTEAQHLLPNICTTPQTVKYWDANASSYTYYAFAVGNDDLKSGKVTVTKTTSNNYNVYLNGYTMAVTADADPSAYYIANRLPVSQSDISSSATINGSNVTLSFRNAMAKVRVGMYETIPGYSVTIDAFRVADRSAPVFGQMTTEVTDKFAANLQGDKPGKAGTVTVVYNDQNSGEENTPEVLFDPEDSSKENVLYLGENLKGGTILGSSAITAVYDSDDKTFTAVYPMENNLSNLKLKVDFTLTSTVGETIRVTDATAEIPSAYLRWRPGCAYTYIFKISDQTNGMVGSLTGLHPITLDAVVVEDAESKELISTVTPDDNNIVTIGFDPETKMVTAGLDEYSVGNIVYASFIISGSLATPSNTNTHLYMVTTDDPDNYPVTEGAVAGYIDDYLADNTLVDQHVTVYKTDVADDDFVSAVPLGNGTDDTQSLPALKWTAARGVYAVEYATENNKIYKIVKIDGADGETEGLLALSTEAVTNMGATIIPTLTVDGVTPLNTEVNYSLDYSGDYGSAVPTTVTVVNNGTADAAVSVPAGTTPGTYTVIATYGRRTYRAAFTVSQ